MASVPNHYRVETARAKLNTYDVFIDHSLDIRGDKNYLSDRPAVLASSWTRATCATTLSKATGVVIRRRAL